jgi:hypothetical protein
MSEIVNLRLARKRKAREDAERTAAERRAQFGRSKAELAAESERRGAAARALDGHRRDRADEP